jgi:hypothetical protein
MHSGVDRDLVFEGRQCSIVLAANFRGEHVYPLSEITAGIKEPVAVPTERAKILGSLPNTKFNEQDQEYLRDWDYVFIYP